MVRGVGLGLGLDIIWTNLLNKFREDWTINVGSRVKNAPPLGRTVFQLAPTIFELVQDISLLALKKMPHPLAAMYANNPNNFRTQILTKSHLKCYKNYPPDDRKNTSTIDRTVQNCVSHRTTPTCPVFPMPGDRTHRPATG
ncbi:hypothetical protein DPMN_113167 [Dreissena polymorpha]|uniref:Uncharacterized protein n=1 Tax=Dreissena polymorpha TaxID=45954 RepID=A0A9D4KHT4_DREPO|nr:hypothetical protein DPMN_113167 [Dreissena polymorpha]